jgi:hypothetical protein
MATRRKTARKPAAKKARRPAAKKAARKRAITITDLEIVVDFTLRGVEHEGKLRMYGNASPSVEVGCTDMLLDAWAGAEGDETIDDQYNPPLELVTEDDAPEYAAVKAAWVERENKLRREVAAADNARANTIKALRDEAVTELRAIVAAIRAATPTR